MVRLAAVLAACVMVGPHPMAASSRDALVLLGDRDYPPITYLEDGTPAGLDVDVAAAISETLGREVRVVLMDWNTAQERVLRGQADGLLSLSVSADRTALFDFTDSTGMHEFGIFVRRGALPLRGTGDLAGKRVGVTRGGMPRRVLESEPDVSLVFIRNYEEGFEQLAAGALDAVAADRWVGSYTLERHDVPNIVMAGGAFASAASGIAVKRGNTEVLDDINHAIREIKANGTLGEIQDRWGPQEMLFVSRQRIDRIMISLLGGGVAAILSAIALWRFTLIRYVRARRAVEREEAERRQMAAEESLRQTEVKYREVVENANDVIFTVDADGYCWSMNRAGREKTGYVAEDARGVHLAQIVAPAHAEYAVRQLKRVLDGEVVPTFELEVLSKDGRRLTFELDVRPYGDGAIPRVQGIARDVTARKELEAQLRHAQKMEAIGRLAGGIAHDFNNLLTVIVGHAELVANALAPDDPIREDAAEIQRAANSARSFTRQLLIFSRKDVVQTAVLDLNEIVDRIERMLRRIVGEHIEFIVRQADGLGSIKADAGQIEQVIMNLVVNARDAMPTGGTLTLETAAADVDEAFVLAHPGAVAGEFARLTVTDTGHGMTPEVQAQIFTPFFTTKGPSTGTGLGLATVQGIVEQSGGWIEVESAIGKGARLSIYLPRLATSRDLRSDSNPKVTPTALATGTILFVEDDESIRALGMRTLRKQGFTVLGARHAAEALQLAVHHQGRIDLLLTDIVMPGLSGRELAERLTKARPDLKVLYTSGYTDDVVAVHDIGTSGPGFMPKPYSPDSLARRVRAILTGA